MITTMFLIYMVKGHSWNGWIPLQDPKRFDWRPHWNCCSICKLQVVDVDSFYTWRSLAFRIARMRLSSWNLLRRPVVSTALLPHLCLLEIGVVHWVGHLVRPLLSLLNLLWTKQWRGPWVSIWFFCEVPVGQFLSIPGSVGFAGDLSPSQEPPRASSSRKVFARGPRVVRAQEWDAWDRDTCAWASTWLNNKRFFIKNTTGHLTFPRSWILQRADKRDFITS